MGSGLEPPALARGQCTWGKASFAVVCLPSCHRDIVIDCKTGMVAPQYGAWLYVGPRGSDLGPCACVAKALPTEPPP